MRGRMLLVAHDPDLGERLAGLFQGSGYAVELAKSVTQARRINFRTLARAVVVPEGLGDETRVLTQELQAVTKLLLVIAASSNQDFATLNASDEASLLAWAGDRPQSQLENFGDVLQFPGYYFDLAGHILTDLTGCEISLTPGEFRLLKAFVQRPGRVLSRENLLTATSGRDADTFDRSIDMLTMRLRRKIEPDPQRPNLIVTVPGAGYKFAARVTRADIRTLIDPARESAPPASATSRLPERRHVTVLQCALSGPTFLAVQRDPEDLSTLLTAFHERCTEIITEAGGFVAGRLSDGIVAYFGYPQADEHQAERAVRAGLKLIDTSRPRGQDTHVGITSGLVVVDGPPQPSGEPTVLGEAVATASKLVFCSDANTVVIADTTRHLISGLFYCCQREPLIAENTAKPLQTWTVEGIVVSESRFESIRAADLSPFIGREAECAMLMDRWSLAQAGEGQAVLLCGEPGIGKSRILKEVLGHLQAGPVEIMRLQCSPHAVNTAYYPIIDNLQRALRFTPEETPDARLDRLEALFVGRYGRPRGDLRFLASILSLPCEPRYDALPVMPQKVKDETLRVLADTAEAAARSRPTAMLFEDMHWADPTTLDVIDHLLTRLSHIPLLLVMTHRPEFGSRWSHRDNLTSVTLPRLTRQQSIRLISGVSRNRTLPPDLLGQVLLKTDGVPLFLEEVTKAALDAVEGRDDGDRNAGAAASALVVPLTLRDSLAARLDRQGPAVRQVAQAAATIGREFDFGLLEAVTDLPKPQLREALDRLRQAGLAFARGAPSDAAYLFKHALVRDVAYDSLLREQRRALHGRIVSALQDRFPEVVQAQPALLAQHCQEAGLMEQSVGFWLKAGQQALAASAMTEAVAQLQRGLHALSGMPDGPWRQQQELDLQAALGAALSATKGLSAAEVGDTFARARALAERLDRREYLMSLTYGQWVFHNVRAEYRLGLPLVEQLEQIGAERNEIAAQLLGCAWQAVDHFWLGEFATARALLERSLANPAHLVVKGAAIDGYIGPLAFLANTLAFLGYIDQARARMDETLSKARRHTHTLAHGLCLASWLDFVTSSPMTYVDELLTLTTEHRFPFYLALGLAFRGRYLTTSGQLQEGLVLLEQGHAELRSVGAAVSTSLLFTWLAEGYAKLGQPDEKRRYLAEATRVIETNEERAFEAELLRVRGDLLKASGNQSEAEQDYRQAIAVAERQSAKLLQLRASTNLARLLREQGRRAEAHDLLALIYGWFTEGFDAPVLREAKTLLDELT